MFVENPRKQKLQIEVKDSVGFGDFVLGAGEVELGSLEDTVPSDRTVTLQGGWRFFRRQSSGEILLRLTYKAYVEDEEDDWVEREVESDSSDDEGALDNDPSGYISGERESGPNYVRERESFVDDLVALLLSEEFQGIVASEKGYTKASNESYYPGLMASRKRAPSADDTPSQPTTSLIDNNSSALIWLAAITSIAVLIACNVGGSGFFNP